MKPPPSRRSRAGISLPRSPICMRPRARFSATPSSPATSSAVPPPPAPKTSRSTRATHEIFISFTDGAPGGDGYPDSRVLAVAKLTSAVNATRQSGGLYKIIEDDADGTGSTFRWARLEQGGEVGASGSGFAAVDNLAFDGSGNVWGVSDMSTGLHSGFTDASRTRQRPSTIRRPAT